ncbi:hypothetical protein L227DRAFT_657890 [Lentinus tigrinus ALCF2SS1-6]|uniref:Uncharacterized protein n=1 Tax=Lentinus tigrinus ALCF2SS1-6 TaxID=1328759 RepID=A0A5C2RS64_9APHY|nr:hypothetical protein L227DRAFT_657890 [Lentinus tigrinus ALCF2SS1-6]
MQAHKLCALWAHPFPRLAAVFDAFRVSRVDPFLVYIICIFACSIAVLLYPSKPSRRTSGQSLVTGLFVNSVSHPVRAQSSPSPVRKISSVPRRDALVVKDSCKSPATVEVDAAVFRKLLEDRLQLHLQVKSFEKSSEFLRHRVWSLERYEKQLVRDTGRDINALVDRLTAEKDAAVAVERQNTAEVETARDAAIKERDALAQEVAELRAVRNTLRTQKDALAADLEALHAETADEVDAFSGDRTILDLEEKLAREGVKTSRAAAEVKRLQDELSTANAQLAVKQTTFDDVTQRMASVTAQLNDELRTMKASLALLQAEHDLQRTQVTAYKTALVRAKMERSQLATTVTSLCAHESVIYSGVRARDAEIARLKAILGPSHFQDVFT